MVCLPFGGSYLDQHGGIQPAARSPGIARHFVAARAFDAHRAPEFRCPGLAAVRRQSVLDRFAEAVLGDSIMALTRPIGWIFSVVAALMLAACGGGGSSGDVHPGADPAVV